MQQIYLIWRKVKMIKNLSNTNFAQIMHNVDQLRGLGIFRGLEANKSYEDTEMHQALTVNIGSMGYAIDANDDYPERLIKAFFAGVSTYLSLRKVTKADEATALILQDTSGAFKFAAVVEYFPNLDNPDEAGNWSYSMTFYEDDITDLEKRKKVNKLLVGDDAFKSIMYKVAYDIGSFEFTREIYIYDSCLLIVDTLMQVLDHEAQDGQVVEVEMPGYFKASVSVENGEKVFAVFPDGHMKEIIKSDMDLDD